MTRIMIVDDAGTVRLYHRDILQRAGYDVEEAINGVEAMEKAVQGSFALFLVDVNMPKLDGYGFLRQLRALPGPQAPAIMVSSEAEAGDRRLALAAGANDYLIKPVTPVQLLRHVGLLLGGVRT
jgi:two-component system chemotaxis response regulator CheY